MCCTCCLLSCRRAAAGGRRSSHAPMQTVASEWDWLCLLLQGSSFFGGVCRQNTAIAAPPRGQSLTCGIAVRGPSTCTGTQILPGMLHQCSPCWLTKLLYMHRLQALHHRPEVLLLFHSADLSAVSTCTNGQTHSCSAIQAAALAGSPGCNMHRLWWVLPYRLQLHLSSRLTGGHTKSHSARWD